MYTSDPLEAGFLPDKPSELQVCSNLASFLPSHREKLNKTGHECVLTAHTFPVEEQHTMICSDTAQASQLISQHIQLATPAGLFPKSLTSVGNMSQPPSSFF